MRHAALLRAILAGRTGVAATAGAAGVLLLVTTLLLVPSQSELVQASLQAADGDTAADATLDGSDTGNRVLAARSYLASGQAARAAALLTPIATRFPEDRTVAALLDSALAATGQAGALIDRQVTIARRGNNPAAWHRVAALARAAAHPVERDALDRLARGDRATVDEIERLATLEEEAGGGAAARTRLDRRFTARGDLSLAGLRHLLRLSLPTASEAAIVPVVAAIEKSGQAPTRNTVVNDLVAGGRPAVALGVADRASGRDAHSLWGMRLDLTRRVHGDAAARAMLARAIATPGDAAPADLVAAGYLLDDPGAIVLAAERGVIPRFSPALALDLARRSETRAPDLIGRIDRVAGEGWRSGDPWLAMRLAERAKDVPTALRYAALLPGAQADAAREAILVRSGDRGALRAWLLSRARTAPATRPAVAERLLALGFRDEALAMLAQAVATAAPEDPGVRRLLYLWGPRPPAAGLAWLNARVEAARDPAARADWLLLRARRSRPQDALRVLEQDRSADRTDVLLARLDLATAAHDRAAADRALKTLLDGRPLQPAQIRMATAAAGGAGPALRQALTSRRVDARVALPHDRLDLAWTAWQRGDAAAARGYVADQLAADPRDAEALRLMADVEAGTGGERRARPWLQRALAHTPTESKESATLLTRLGRHDEALAIMERLRRQAPADKALVADHARLLVAAGRPGRAQALFAR